MFPPPDQLIEQTSPYLRLEILGAEREVQGQDETFLEGILWQFASEADKR